MAAAAAAAEQPRGSGGADYEEEAARLRAEQEELEEQRERQRWQDRYEFTDEEIEEELGQEAAWKEKLRRARHWVRYYMNAFEVTDNLAQRRERTTILNWKDVRHWKEVVVLLTLAYMFYSMDMKSALFAKILSASGKGGGADWPTHFINLREIHEGKRSLDSVVLSWEKVRDLHQRDWLLPLMAAQALESFVSDPPALRQDSPSVYIIDKLAEQLEFVEGDVVRMSAEIAVHINNLLQGDVKWPGREPSEAVRMELSEYREKMVNFRIHPILQEAVDRKRQEPVVMYSGSGYFDTKKEDLIQPTAPSAALY